MDIRKMEEEEKELQRRIAADKNKPDVSWQAFLRSEGMKELDFSKVPANSQYRLKDEYEHWKNELEWNHRAMVDRDLHPNTGYLPYMRGPTVESVYHSVERVGLIARYVFHAEPLTCGQCGESTWKLYIERHEGWGGCGHYPEPYEFSYCPECWKKHFGDLEWTTL